MSDEFDFFEEEEEKEAEKPAESTPALEPILKIPKILSKSRIEPILKTWQKKGIHITKYGENGKLSILTQDLIDLGYTLPEIEDLVRRYTQFSFGMGVGGKDVDGIKAIFFIEDPLLKNFKPKQIIQPQPILSNLTEESLKTILWNKTSDQLRSDYNTLTGKTKHKEKKEELIELIMKEVLKKNE